MWLMARNEFKQCEIYTLGRYLDLKIVQTEVHYGPLLLSRISLAGAPQKKRKGSCGTQAALTAPHVDWSKHHIYKSQLGSNTFSTSSALSEWWSAIGYFSNIEASVTPQILLKPWYTLQIYKNHFTSIYTEPNVTKTVSQIYRWQSNNKNICLEDKTSIEILIWTSQKRKIWKTEILDKA